METGIYRDSDFSGILSLDSQSGTDSYASAVYFRHAASIHADTFLVARDEERNIAGYCIGGIIPGNPEDGWILKIYVDCQRRHEGIGRRLLEETIGVLEDSGVKKICLTVSPANEPALLLYQRYGFTPEERIKDYFGEGEDRFLMVRNKSHPEV
ncbi:GNAT family N-acetyltransferase [Methanoplanus limicola]|uniref:GCN5-related N-acetyltransferase n=1 Tax=Methanoplanus limicola DSM 2279 TaxID=937775 RepID=H1Z2E0_9EURY|nr:GNAT family N-acetyltransferase [Methanoplanus limicola]EHQ35466.1 GCN5-related N-acetyltransferase [Methanoplanus limicola DSM 2279]